MARRTKINFPQDAKLRATGDKIVLLDQHIEGGIPVYRVKDTDGEIRDYQRNAVVVPRDR